MALLNNSGSGVAPATPTPLAGVKDSKKEKKAEAAKRHAEKRAKAIQEDYQNALKLRDILTKAGEYDKLPEDLKAYLIAKCVDPKERKSVGGGGGLPTILVQLFGEGIKVGDKITLRQAFDKTAKGKATLDILVRRWSKDSGVEVKVVPNKDVMLTEYVVTKLP
jgi:hypothetical protein